MIETLDPVGRVQDAIRDSSFLRELASIRGDGGLALALPATRLRALAQSEIELLERQGNWAADWSQIRVAADFDPRSVQQCRFHGAVVLGQFRRPVRLTDRLELPSGVYRSTLAHAVVGHDALIDGVGLLSHYVVNPGATVCNCGMVTCDRATSFGNGASLAIAIETGGRDVAVYAEIDVEVAARIARCRADRDLLARYREAVREYADRANAPVGVIGAGATVRDTPAVRNTYVGPSARVAGATLVEESTLLSSPEEPVQVLSGAWVRSSLLQWGSRVDSMALLDSAVLTEHSYAERHGKVIQSILGPNTGVAEGEVSASLLGPFVGFHHQSLLIAALWPEGRGNVAYGANVGSNHTSRAPDQEFWPGEGAYLGLGVNIKYPSDFTRAPYTIVAMGVSTLPQQLAFPFALVNQPWGPMPNVSPAYNEIIPAWVLRENLYTLKRNEAKFRARDRARRTRFDFAVFRPDTVDLMRDATRRLEQVATVRDFYTEADLAGLGKNVLREAHRRPAIETYHFFIRLYALLGLKDRLGQQVDGRSSCLDILAEPSSCPRWEHQRCLLREAYGLTDPIAALTDLPAMLEKVARDVEQSKAKDDERGLRILDDYGDAHVRAEADPFVRQTWEETGRLIHEVQQLLMAGRSP